MTNEALMIIEPRRRDLGGFSVGRVLPYAKRRMVGPFIFFDEIGPAEFAPGTGIDVRAHPHIGLATVTYLFEGELRHRDSLGFDQTIRPGDVNWMTAGRGIAHSERTDDALRRNGQRMHGIQSWVALPADAVETAPSFHHHPAAALPLQRESGLLLRLIAGEAFGLASPVKTFSPMFYAAVEADAGATLPLPDHYEERALYILSGAVTIDGEHFAQGRMIVCPPGAKPLMIATTPLRAILLGGAPVGERLIWWNFVATSEERLEKAKRDWSQSIERGFDGTPFLLPPGESEFIPLPTE